MMIVYKQKIQQYYSNYIWAQYDMKCVCEHYKILLILVLSGYKTTYRFYMPVGKAPYGVHSINNFVFKISMKFDDD